MKLEWLEAISEVAALSSFSEAAEAIPCAQSSISRHVKRAEDELGVVIFNRSSNSNLVTLTSKGEQILPLVHKLLEDYRQLQTACRPRSQRRPQSLRLGLNLRMYSSACKGNLMSTLYMAYPEIHLTLKEFAPDTRLGALHSGKVDALLVPRARPVDEPCVLRMGDDYTRCEFVGRQELSIAYGAAFAPAGRKSITLQELKGIPVIFHTDIVKAYDPGSMEYSRSDYFVKACLDSGFEPEIRLVDQNLADIKQALTVQGEGVFPSTIPSGLRAHPGICYIPVENAPFCTQYFVLWPKQNHNPAIPKLIEVLKGSFGPD